MTRHAHRDMWQTEINSLPIVSTHEHHREDHFQMALDLDKILGNTYVYWCQEPPKPDFEDRERYLDEIRYNSYFVWLQKAIQDVYDVDGCIDPNNWDEISDRIARSHRSREHHMQILREQCRYKAAIQDTYWDPGSDVGYPDMFKPTFRIDAFFNGYHPEVRVNSDLNPLVDYSLSSKSFSEYLDDMETVIRERRNTAVALKTAVAYHRIVNFSDHSPEQARQVFGKHPDELSAAEIKVFEDTVFDRVCTVAAELDLPVQVHLGLALIAGSNPMHFEPVIARHPRTRFVLFHGGYPWYQEIAGLAHNYDNVIIDLCWLPLISTSAAVQALHQYIDVARSSSRITWGGDTWTSEEAYGATLAFRHVLARVIEEKVTAGAFGWREGLRLAEKIAFHNAESIYSIA